MTHPWPARAAAYRRAATAEIDADQVNEAIDTFKKIIAKMEAALANRHGLWVTAILADVALRPFIDRLERLDMTSLAPDDKRMPAPHRQAVASYLATAAAPAIMD